MATNGASPQSRWVVGVDGSSCSEHALRWAVANARSAGAQVRAVRAWQLSISGAGGFDTPYVMEQGPKVAQAGLDEMAAAFGDDASSVEWTIEYGNPASTLMEAGSDADLLVTGSRGLGGFKRLILGSVSHQCASHAGIPVAVIPEGASAEGRIRTIIVGMDGSDNAKAALRWALEFAPTDAIVRVVGAWDPSALATETDRKHFDELAESERERFEAAIDETLDGRNEDPRIETEFLHARPATALLGQCDEETLLVVGVSGRGWFGSAILGSVASRVLHDAPCAVVVVPKPPE